MSLNIMCIYWVLTEVIAEPVHVPEPEPEPVPVVERPVRSRGKTPVTTRTRSSQHHTVSNKQQLQFLLNTDGCQFVIKNRRANPKSVLGFFQIEQLKEIE